MLTSRVGKLKLPSNINMNLVVNLATVTRYAGLQFSFHIFAIYYNNRLVVQISVQKIPFLRIDVKDRQTNLTHFRISICFTKNK